MPTAQETLEEAIKKNSPKDLPGLEFERVIKTRDFIKPDENAELFVVAGPKSDYSVAGPYKAAAKQLAKTYTSESIDDKFLLMASIRKLSEHYKTEGSLNFNPYLSEGIEKEIQDLAKKATEQKVSEEDFKKLAAKKKKEVVVNNLKKYEKDIGAVVKGADTVWTDPKLPIGVTPPDAIEKYDGLKHLMPDFQGANLQGYGMLAEFISQYGNQQDQKNLAEGNRIYVVKYKKVKKEGKDELIVDHIIQYKRKN